MRRTNRWVEESSDQSKLKMILLWIDSIAQRQAFELIKRNPINSLHISIKKCFSDPSRFYSRGPF